jgi:hypothetical protein
MQNHAGSIKMQQAPSSHTPSAQVVPGVRGVPLLLMQSRAYLSLQVWPPTSQHAAWVHMYFVQGWPTPMNDPPKKAHVASVSS